jgi:hypothetical protein
MTREQARTVFDAEVDKAKAAGDDDRVARVELMREYFTNPPFRRAMEDFVFARVSGKSIEGADVA